MNNHKINPDPMFFNKLAEAISLLAREVCESREQRKIELEWLKRERVDPEKLKQLTVKLRDSQKSLVKAVNRNQPISG